MDEQVILRDRVLAAAMCQCCGRRRVTHEQLAAQTGLSLRSVVRFLQGDRMHPKTATAFEVWLKGVV